MSSISSSFMNKINTKYEAWRLIHDQTRLFVLLYSKYGEVQEDFLYMITNQLIFNLPTSLNSHFKEIKYSNYTKEYLKRLYKTKESKIRIPKLSDYYKNYHLFFCRPILRHFKLLKIMGNFQDKKAEIFYKNNYKTSKDNISGEKEENNFKKNSSNSLTSFDNVTNNKIIFDKYTKKMLDKSETELKNNNYYNTLNLESSRSNIGGNNGLISKRNGDANSFEKCIHALIEYQYNKKEKIKNKNNKKIYLKNRKIKNILISNNSTKTSQIKKDINQSFRPTNKSYNFNLYNQQVRLLNKNYKLNTSKNSNNNINITINKVIKNKKKKRKLYALTNSRYNTSTGTLIGYKINKINNNLNQNSYNYNSNMKENKNNNYPVTTTNKESKKNRIHYLPSNSNINKTKSNYSKFTQFTEFLIQSQKRQEKSLFHTKNSLSIGDSQNIYFNFINNKNNRITKKKVTLNKNLKINTSNANANFSTQNIRKSKHGKNKTFDYNTINNSNNYIQTDNIICTEEFNASIKKNQKKKTFIINIDNNDIQKSSTNSKKNMNLISPSSNKLYNKISATSTCSRDKNTKMRVKKCQPININSNKGNKLYSHHKKNNKSVLSNDLINNTFNLSKPFNKLNKKNICLSPHPFGNITFNVNNINPHLSPQNQIYKNIVYLKTNVNHNLNNNNIYIKKAINKDNIFINNPETNNALINSCNLNNNFNKEFSHNFSLYKNANISNNNLINNTTSNINNENKRCSRNKKMNLKANFNNSKKSNINAKTNSTVSNRANGLNYNFIINNNLKNNNNNINISIGKNNINIKDSILHIDKIYIKKESKKKNNTKLQRLYENNNYFIPKKTLEMNLDNNLIKVEVNETKKKKGRIKTMDFSPKIKGISQNIINVHRNLNLVNNKNVKEVKKKFI